MSRPVRQFRSRGNQLQNGLTLAWCRRQWGCIGAAWRLVFAIFAAFGVLALVPSLAKDTVLFQVDGSIEMKRYGGPDDATELAGSFSFSCTVGEERWLIENDFIPGHRTSFFCDGTNVYRTGIALTLNPAPTNSIFQAADVTVDQVNSANNLLIIPGDHPLGNIGVNVPWLAFCSARYLKREGRLIPLPICVVRHTSKAFGFTDDTTVFEDSLGLPASVRLLESPELGKLSVDSPRIALSNSPMSPRGARDLWPMTLEDGRVACTYEVLSSTSFNGCTVPLEFTLAQQTHSWDGTAHSRIVATGKVRSLTSGQELISPFDDESKTYSITDLRFRSTTHFAEGLRYRHAGGIPSTNDTVLLSRFGALEGKQPRLVDLAK